MKKVKERWDTAFSIVSRAAKNLVDSARMGKTAMENNEMATAQIPLTKDQERRHTEWETDVKVTLINFDNE